MWLMVMPLMVCAQLQAPLGTGISWSWVAWNEEMTTYTNTTEFQQYHDSHEGCPDIKRIFMSLYNNYNMYNSYNDSIFVPTFRDDWAEMIRHRAQLQTQMYAQNQRDIDSVLHFFRNEREIPDCAYNALLRSVHHLFRNANNDFFLMDEFITLMLPHYESRPDELDRLMQCYIMKGYYEYQFSRINDSKEHSGNATEYFRKAIALTDNMNDFTSRVTPFYLLSAYRNIMVSLALSRDVEVSEAYNLHLELEKLYRRNQRYFNETPNLLNYLKWIIQLFNYKAPYICIVNGDTKSSMFRILYSNYLRQVGNNPQQRFENMQFTYDSDLWIDYLFIQSHLGKMTAAEAFYLSRTYIGNKLDSGYESLFTKNKTDITYIYNTFATSLYMLERADLPDQDKHDYLLKYMARITHVMSNYPKALNTSERVDAERRIITMPLLRKYLTTQERLKQLDMLILIEQPQTYAHVSMVSSMCDAILDAVINFRPDMLRDIPGCETRIKVWQNADSLKAYFHQAALYHDLGKNLIPSIVSNSFRKLTDHEFSYIKKHPEMAKVFLDVDPSLSKYKDICFGHHKWYNGKGGYPTWFDNTKSPLRILIDILTICDCLDAATDNLGRNYHNSKRFKTVLGEFDRDADVKYNPELVKMMHELPTLNAALTQIVDEKRMDAYYNIYRQYFR